MSEELIIPAEPTPVSPSPRRRGRLRILVGLSAALFGLYGFGQLDRATATRLGPVSEVAYSLIHPSETGKAEDSALARQFKTDVKALNGTPNVAVLNPGVFGIFGRKEEFSVSVNTRAFDDAALAKLADKYGDRIGNLLLHGTGVTDAGLRSLARFSRLHQLAIDDYALQARTGVTTAPPRISNAGMVHLSGLKNLTFLSLAGLPITDDGLAAVEDLPKLDGFYLQRTLVEGHNLARFKSLPGLAIVYLNGIPFSEDGLKALQKAGRLQILALDQVPLETTAIPLLKALSPTLNRLEITGCGFLDEEVATLKRPGLKIIRQ